MSTHNEIFNAFVEAQKALDELPNARQQITDLQHSLDVCSESNHAKDGTIQAQQSQIETLQAQLAEAKKSADEATFRELQARDHLENLVKVIHGAADTSNTAKEFLNPTPPAPEVVETSPEPTATAPTSAANTDVSSSHSESGQSEVPPDSTTGSTTAGEGIVGIDPMVAPYDNRPLVDHGDGRLTMPEPEGQSETPFASSATSQSQPAQPDTGVKPTGLDTGSPAPQSADASPPNRSMPYWTKPTYLTWRQWQGQGNLVPNWINDLDTH